MAHVLYYDVVVCSLSSWNVVLEVIRCRLEQCSKSAWLSVILDFAERDQERDSVCEQGSLRFKPQLQAEPVLSRRQHFYREAPCP